MMENDKDTNRQVFQAELRLEGKTATGIQVPAQVVEALGAGKRPPVRVTLASHTYRTTVAAYGEVYMIPVAAEHRTAAGLHAGQMVTVTLELDTEPRVVDAPADFAAALAAEPDAQRAFDRLSYSNKRRWVLSIEEAKTLETRLRRIARALDELRAGKG